MSLREFIAFYRRCAAYCLEITHDFEDPGCKADLLSMAQTWTALADQVERAGDTTRGHPADRGRCTMREREPVSSIIAGISSRPYGEIEIGGCGFPEWTQPAS